jgi:cytochrome P450
MKSSLAVSPIQAKAREEAYRQPIETLNPAQPELFQQDAMWPLFERLRKEDPVHFTRESDYGPYWSITKYNDIMAVDTNHQVFSSEPAITIVDPVLSQGPLPMFIAMDPPKHDVQRKTVSPPCRP